MTHNQSAHLANDRIVYGMMALTATTLLALGVTGMDAAFFGELFGFDTGVGKIGLGIKASGPIGDVIETIGGIFGLF